MTLGVTIPVLIAMVLGFVLPGRLTLIFGVVMLALILVSAYVEPGSNVSDMMIDTSFVFLFTLPFFGLAALARAGYKRLFSADEPIETRWDVK